jgi:hypothetical protein
VLSFSHRFYSAEDGWSVDGRKLTEKDLEQIGQTIEETGPILMKHWFYRGSSNPAYHVFTDHQEFKDYLFACAAAGDAIDVWCLDSLLETKPIGTLFSGKCANEAGEVPLRGAY